MRLKNICVFVLTAIIALAAQAAVPAWQITPAESKINFTATQNNAPVTGSFKTFSGDIQFDPAQLNTSKVNIVVDINSMDSSYQEMSDSLKTADWFNVKLFPKAVFAANKFTKTGNNTYQAIGVLTLRDKTVPVTLDFTVQDFSATHFKASGNTTVKRTAFGVGQGEWAKTDGVKDEVKVEFVLSAVKK
jgi:polyisoprenoid-binding protein YceI